jgi:tetratricopeptide (TPR) repeat protein
LKCGKIYFEQDDFNKALNCYLKILEIDNSKYDIIYKIGKTLNRMFEDKSEVVKNLENLFLDNNYINNVLVIVDVLINEKLYKEANIYIEKIKYTKEYEIDKLYLMR